jgi:YbbR domain-containing protein
MRLNLRHNLVLKVFSLLLAVVCWYVVRSEEVRLRDFVVPVEYVGLPAELDLSGRVIDTVNVRLRATEPVLRGLSQDALLARVDLNRVATGEHRLPITPEMIRIPPGAEVARIEPDLLPLRIEKKVRRDVPVVAEFEGQPPSGYAKIRHAVEPAQVTIEGPASDVARVHRAVAGIIHLEGETADLQVAVTPIPEAPPGSRVRVVVPSGPVRVLVSIRPEREAPAGAAAAPSARPSRRPATARSGRLR